MIVYLRRHGDQLALSVEHRAAAAITAVELELAIDGDAVALATLDRTAATTKAAAEPALTTLADKVMAALASSTSPVAAADALQSPQRDADRGAHGSRRRRLRPQGCRRLRRHALIPDSHSRTP